MGITLRQLWELIETSITGRESFLSRSCGVLVMCARKRVPLKTGLMASGTQNGPFSEKGLFRPFWGRAKSVVWSSSCGVNRETEYLPKY